jgi:hypothetical protein
MREKFTKIVGGTAFVLSLIPTAVAALLVWSHTPACPWGAFLDPVLEAVMEYGLNWTYWLALAFGVLGGAGVITTLYLAKSFPPRLVWILDIFTVVFAMADVFLFFMVFEAGSKIR